MLIYGRPFLVGVFLSIVRRPKTAHHALMRTSLQTKYRLQHQTVDLYILLALTLERELMHICTCPFMTVWLLTQLRIFLSGQLLLLSTI